MYAGELTARMLCAGYLQGKIDACQVTEGVTGVCWVCIAGVERTDMLHVPVMPQQMLGFVAIACSKVCAE